MESWKSEYPLISSTNDYHLIIPKMDLTVFINFSNVVVLKFKSILSYLARCFRIPATFPGEVPPSNTLVVPSIIVFAALTAQVCK
ncbi:hypothetical protein Pfo_000105, partial [Paulownia fortunei]